MPARATAAGWPVDRATKPRKRSGSVLIEGAAGPESLISEVIAFPADAEVIKRLVTAWGGQVVDQLNVDTDFLVIGKVPAQQRLISFTHAALAELLAECRVNRFAACDDHQPGGAKIEPMNQRAARKKLHQPMMHRIEVLRIFA